MTEKVATGVLSGVVKVSGFFTSSVANTKAGKKFFNLLPGEIVLASLDGFSMFIILRLGFVCSLSCIHCRTSNFHNVSIVQHVHEMWSCVPLCISAVGS